MPLLIAVADAGSHPHVQAWIAVPLGMLAGVALGALWWWVGRDDVPRSRRIIRRVSITLALMLVPLLVAGAGIIDPGSQPRRYVEVWVGALALLGLIVVTAVVDVINSVRLLGADRGR